MDATLAAESPPEKKSARPLARDEQQTDTTTSAEAQPHLELCKLWMRCGPQSRWKFLGDVKAAHPALWEKVSREGP
jgi:hypothetical protein